MQPNSGLQKCFNNVRFRQRGQNKTDGICFFRFSLNFER